MTIQDPTLWWRPTTSNSKTGPIPTAYVRKDKADDSCAGCPMFRKRCYAWRGYVRRGLTSMAKAQPKNPNLYRVRAALMGRQFAARYARLTAIGDPTGAPVAELRDAIDAIQEAGLQVIGYTSQWKRRPAYRWLRSHLLASTVTDGQTASAIDDGWKVSQVVSADRFIDALSAGHITTREGYRLRLCPHMAAQFRHTLAPTCNDCGQCTVRSMTEDGFDGVAFPEHGPTATGRPWTLAVRAQSEGAE